jgi:chaperonin GroES
MALRPLEDKVILKVEKEAEVKTTSGLVLAGNKDELPSEGTVIAVGPGMVFKDGDIMKLDVKVGDKVIFAKYSGNKIEHKGEEFISIPYRDIYAVVEED